MATEKCYKKKKTKSKGERLSFKKDELEFHIIDCLRERNENILSSFSHFEKCFSQFSNSALALSQNFYNELFELKETRSQSLKFVHSQKQMQKKSICFLNKLDPFATELLDFRAEIMSLEKRRDMLLNTLKEYNNTISQLSILNDPKNRPYKMAVITWEYKEKDVEILIEKVSSKKKTLFKIISSEKINFEKMVSNLEKRHNEHIKSFMGHLEKNLSKFYNFSLHSLEEELKELNTSSDLSSSSKISNSNLKTRGEKCNETKKDKRREKESEETKNVLREKQEKEEKEKCPFDPLDKSEDEVGIEKIKDEFVKEKNVEIKDKEMAIKLKDWEFKNGKRRNIRSLLSSLQGVLRDEALVKWEKVTLSELVSHEEVKKQYRKAILLLHPDRGPGGEEERKVAAKAFFVINSAWKEYLKTR